MPHAVLLDTTPRDVASDVSELTKAACGMGHRGVLRGARAVSHVAEGAGLKAGRPASETSRFLKPSKEDRSRSPRQRRPLYSRPCLTHRPPLTRPRAWCWRALF